MGTNHFGEDFVGHGEEGDGAPLPNLPTGSPLGEVIDQSLSEALWHLSAREDLLEGCKEWLVNLLPEGGEESSREPVLSRAFLPVNVSHSILHLCSGKRGKEGLTHARLHKGRRVSPNLLPAMVGARVWGLLLEEGSVEVRCQIHNLVRIYLDTAILRSERANLLPCCSLTVSPEELCAPPITFPSPEGLGSMEREL